MLEDIIQELTEIVIFGELFAVKLTSALERWQAVEEFKDDPRIKELLKRLEGIQEKLD